MHPTTKNTLLATAALVATYTSAYALDGTWTNNGNGLWSAGGNWSGGTVADGSGFTANFSTVNINADRTVSLDSARTIGNLIFADATTPSNGWILNNNSNAANTLTLAGGTPTITVNALGAGKDATISAGLLGSSGLTKAGVGTLVLTGGNNYTGVTNVTGGALIFGTQTSLYNNTAASWTAANLVVESGAALAFRVGGTGEFSAGNVTTLLTNLSTVNNNGLKAGSSIGFDTTNASGSSFTVANNITDSTGTGGGSIGFQKFGGNNLLLTGTNTYTGVTTVNAGVLTFGTQASLYNNVAANWTPANLVVNSGATMAFRVGGANEFNTSNVTTLLTNLSTVNNNGLKAGSSIGFDTTNASGGTFTISDNIANSTGTGGGAIGLQKLGSNTLILSGTNTYTGLTTVGLNGSTSGGTLTVTGSQSTGGWFINNGTVNFQSGSTVSVGSAGINTQNGGANNLRLLNVAGTVTNTGALNIGGGANFTLNSGADWTQSGAMSVKPNTTFTSSSLTVNTGAIFKYTGGSAIALSASPGTNGGSGTLSIAGGTFQTGQGFVNSGGTAGTANLLFSTGGTLRLTANIANLASNSGTTTPFNVQLGTGGGKIDTNGFNTTLDLGIGNVSGQTGSLTKDGAGTMTLAGLNTYTGDTLVNNGTLSLAAAGAMLFQVTDSAFTDISGLGTLSLDGTMNLDVTALTATSGSWLLVNNATLTESYGSNFNVKFNGGASFTEAGNVWTNGNWSFDEGSGLLTLAVPEPSVALLGGLGMLALLRRRRD